MFLTVPRCVGENMQSENGADADADGGKQGRACESCYRAKAKCIPQEGRSSDKCSR